MTATNVSSAGLHADQLGEFERLLRTMLKERIPPASVVPADLARHRARTDALESALSRIEEGTFGACRWCGKGIGVPRLELVPTAEGCMACMAGRR